MSGGKHVSFHKHHGSYVQQVVENPQKQKQKRSDEFVVLPPTAVASSGNLANS